MEMKSENQSFVCQEYSGGVPTWTTSESLGSESAEGIPLDVLFSSSPAKRRDLLVRGQ